MNRPTGTINYTRLESQPKKPQIDKKHILTVVVFTLMVLVFLLFTAVIVTEVVYKVNGEPTKNPAYAAGDVKYTDKEVSSSDIHTGKLLIVNGSYKYVFPDKTELTTLSTIKNSSYFVSKNDLLIDRTVAGELNSMMSALQTATSFQKVQVTSAYRTYDKQAANHEGYSDEVEAGASEHHTGYCVDMNIIDGNTFALADNSVVNSWLLTNCYKYGFIERYPDSKSEITGLKHDFATKPRTTHFTYVGFPHAYYMTNNNLCLEEYTELLRKQYTYAGDHLKFDADDGNSYEVYYFEANDITNAAAKTNLPVPKNYEYSVSGDNMGGFIVTINISKPVK